jgi:hypothetical protein
MLMGSLPAEFREPTVAEIADAADAIVEEYLTGDDRYGLHQRLGESLLEALFTEARKTKNLPWKQWDALVWDEAEAMAKNWYVQQWTAWRDA